MSSGAVILTPDQRVRVFVSSTLEELADERRVAREAIERLRLTPVMFELGARPHPPRDVYRGYLQQSDVFVGIYGERYGWVAPEMEISGLEDEYTLAHDLPRLIYVKRTESREPRLEALLARVMEEGDVSFRLFADAEELRTLIQDDLALLLSERFEARRPPFRTSLPAGLDTFVGRAAELEELEHLLTGSDARLVCVTGPGGVGKTRLVLEAARRVAPRFAHGAHFVPLADVTDAELVSQTIYDSLGIGHGTASPLSALADTLRDVHMLLILDNLEHVLPAAGDVQRLLEQCPRLSVLATSRTVLNVRGEREVRIEPLVERDAVGLFVDRARAASSSFELTDENAAEIGEICRRLDGIPLALELAAAHVRLLPPGGILDHLGSPLGLRSRGATYPERHQTLQAAIDWSFGLLDENARALCERASVFRGGFSLGALTAVAASGERDVLEPLAALVESSLVRRDPAAAPPRYSMLETIRAAGLERLESRGELADARQRHAAYFLQVVEDAGEQARRAQHEAALGALDSELDNVRAAFDWLLERGETERVVAAGWALLPYWTLRERLFEGRSWLERARERGGLGQQARARSLIGGGVLELWLSNYLEASSLLSEGVELARTAGDDEPLAVAEFALGTLDAMRGAESGIPMLEASRRVFAEHGNLWGEAMSLIGLAWALNVAEAEAPLELYLTAVQKAGGLGSALETVALGALGRRHALRGETADAKHVLGDALERTLEIGASVGSALYLDLLGELAALAGDARLAARLAGAAEAAVEAVGTILPAMAGKRAARLEDLRAALGDEEFERERAGGRALKLEDATAEALEFARD